MQRVFGWVLAVASGFGRGVRRSLRLPLDRRHIGMAAAATIAALLAGPGALAQELETIRITSNPGSDDTYSSDGEDSTIVFEAEWALQVSVRGANLVFIMGDEEREAFCPQTEDCNTCPVFRFECSYEVQPGDLDEDGVSIPAGAPFRGSITRNDSNINQASCTDATNQECTYPGLPDQAGHKVDGGAAGEPSEPEPTEPDPPDQGGTGDHTGRIASTLLAIGPPQIGTIDGADDVDYYRIDLAGSATVTVATAGPTDTSGELLDGNGALIASDDDSGPGAGNFQLTEALEAGVYYVAVSGAEGGYALTALLADAGDQGGTAASSSLLTFYGASEVASVTSIGSSALLSTVGTIDEAMADLDYFRIDVPRHGTDVTVRSAGSTDTAGRLLDSALEEVAADDGGDGNFRIETTLDAGTYYLEVMGEAGRYRVIASGSDPDCACAEEAMAMGDHGGTAETSTLMPIGPPLTGEIADADDVDVFRIDLAGNASVTFAAAGPTDTMAVLKNGAGEELASADGGGPAMNFGITEELAPGRVLPGGVGRGRQLRGERAARRRLGHRRHGRPLDPADALQPGRRGQHQAERPAVDGGGDRGGGDGHRRVPAGRSAGHDGRDDPQRRHPGHLRLPARRLADGAGHGRRRRRLPHRDDPRRRHLLRRGGRPRNRPLPRARLGRLPGTLRLRWGRGRRLVGKGFWSSHPVQDAVSLTRKEQGQAP